MKVRDGSKSLLYKSMFIPTIPMQKGWELIEIFSYVKSFSVIFLADYNDDLEKSGVASFTFDDIGVEIQQEEVIVFFALFFFYILNPNFRTLNYHCVY